MTIKMGLLGENDEDSQNEESRINVFVQQMLISRIFAATYTGRNYVHLLKDYRDMLKINEEENDVIRDLEIVKKRINNHYKGAMWSSITGPEDSETDTTQGVCVWTRLENVAFGSYWFLIKNVSFSDVGELVFDLKVLRKFEAEPKTAQIRFDSSMNWDEIKANILISSQEIGTYVVKALQELLTWHNIKESSRFVFLLLMTIGTGLIYGLQYLGDYSIKFFREFNNFVRVMTPIFLAIIEMVSKTIGGFYLLIVMLWRGHNQAPVPQFPSLMAAPHQFKPGHQKRFSPEYRKQKYY